MLPVFNLQYSPPHTITIDKRTDLRGREELLWARSRLLRWFRSNVRNYPWRETNNPYFILVAELMLQRTRADQVKPVYEKFVVQYPNLTSAANAKLTDLKKLLWPLGLHGRASVFRQMAKDIESHFGGQVPMDRHRLKQITGVGDYVAGAVLSVAFNSREWIVDSNVVRVLSRFTGIQPSGEARRSKQVIEMAKEYCATRTPRNANLALLDHAALICKPHAPNCSVCPLKQRCVFSIGSGRTKTPARS